MSSLINSAMSGLSAAQAALSTTSNNISNYRVDGYSRQTADLSSLPSTLSGSSYYGNGVTVSGVHREYDEFITGQLRSASAQNSGITSQYNQISNIDDLMSSSSNSLSTTLSDFFTTLQNVVSNADDPSARQTLMGKASGLVNQFKVTDQYLRNMDSSINTNVASSIQQINSYSSQIANLNGQIGKLQAAGAGADPNSLMDQRDALVNKLNDLVGVNVSKQDGSYIVSMSNGLALVNGSDTKELVAMPSSSDPTRTTVGYVDKTAGNVEIPENLVSTGSLGGLLKFRNEDLDSARNKLNQLALNFADSFNTQHKAGFDSKGNAGTDFFSIGGPSVVSNSKNGSSVTLTASWSDTSKAQATDYKVSWDGSNWNVKRLSDNTNVSATLDANGKLNFDGLQLTPSGTPSANDSFVVKPVSNAIVNMDVAISNESQIAAASATGGESDNRNAQKLLDLQSKNLVNGNATLSQAYASLVSDIGNKTNTLKTTSETQTNVVTQLTNRQQSVSGVNLDEEYANLQRYQQYYMANAQVLQTASAIFDALINIRG
ncbi:MAG: flagellar hook-associated protein FlgK [Mixta calida]|uniref:Flagellar hook-associated protein 1 n=1 Tax=Mixta calida TaxID=665913 RepID=A0ABN5H8P2_9GAMM|nr:MULTISPECIES: flagellar hook-associated protein FlgK [Mixta]MBS6058123.1 flagellar hook-associated protein FlgK [Pantoea sp.]AUY24900.1 flagellar hook-associated protein FlgK [Mixta calida]KAF0860468.1 flagellar hook-associated protein FlgK [Mixta calida B021323]MCR1566960.1 flagellar hook-associated protein FlgK [Mixta sp.]MDU3815089.1 flagellar hook-associated protein FlgK [Pantoea sp.]